MEVKELDYKIKSGKIEKFYFFYGPEHFLIENKIELIKNKFLGSSFDEFCFIRFNGKDSSIEEFKNEFYSYSMTGENKIIVLQNTGWFLNSKSTEFTFLKDILTKDFPESICLIVREDSFEKKKEKNLDIFSINDIAVVNFERIPQSQLCEWVDKLFLKAEKNVKQADISYIVQASDYDMEKIYSEVNKLIIYSVEDSSISSETVRMLVVKSCEYKIYELFDDIVEAREKSAAEKLKMLLDSKEKPTTIISGLANKFSELLTVKLLNSDRVPVRDMIGYFDFNVPEFVVKKMVNQSKKFGEKYLRRMVKTGINFDRMIKTGNIDSKTAAQMYVAELIRKD